MFFALAYDTLFSVNDHATVGRDNVKPECDLEAAISMELTPPAKINF